MKNKAYSLALATLLSLTLLAGCTAKPTISAASQSERMASSATTSSAPSIAASTPSNAASGGEKALMPSRGQWDGATYHNEFANLTYTLPENWIASTDEEMATMMGIGIDMMQDASMNFTPEMLEMQTLYDMMARDTTTNSNVAVMFENLSVMPGGIFIDEAAYLEALKIQLSQVTQINYTIGEVSEVTLGGETYQSLQADDAALGISQTYFLRKKDNFMIGLIATTMANDDLATIMANFA